jgi:hypothetical protein
MVGERVDIYWWYIGDGLMIEWWWCGTKTCSDGAIMIQWWKHDGTKMGEI